MINCGAIMSFVLSCLLSFLLSSFLPSFLLCHGFLPPPDCLNIYSVYILSLCQRAPLTLRSVSTSKICFAPVNSAAVFVYCTSLYILVLLSQSVSWLALRVGSGVMDSDAGQDTGSRCSLLGGTAEASERTQSGLGRFWPLAGKGLFQWENPMATWPPRSNPAGGQIRLKFNLELCYFCFVTHFSTVIVRDDIKKCKKTYIV